MREESVPCFPLWLADGHFTFTWHSPCVWVCLQIARFHKDSRLGLGPTLMASFSLDNFCKDPICRKGHILEAWGLRLGHKWKRRHNSIPNSTHPATAFNYVFNQEVNEHGPVSFLSPLEDSSPVISSCLFKSVCPLRKLKERDAWLGYIQILQHTLARFESGRAESGSQAGGKPEMGSGLGNLHLRGSSFWHIAGWWEVWLID